MYTTIQANKFSNHTDFASNVKVESNQLINLKFTLK